MSEKHRPGVAILASGSGSTAESFIHATQDGRVDAEVGLVVCNNPPEKARIYDRISQLNSLYGLDIEMIHISGVTHPEGNVGRGQTLSESEAIADKFAAGRFAHLALMGYMKKLNGDLVEAWGWNPGYNSIYQAMISNTHPGPLPETADTYGLHTSEKVLDLGLAASKHTVHIVAEGIDKGPIIAEHPVPIEHGDTAQDLFDRVQVIEKVALPYAIDKFIKEQEAYNGDS